MKVRFAADVLEDARAWQILDRIVDHFVAQRHLWAIEEPDTIIESSWIQTDLDLGGRAGRANLEACQKCYTDTIYASQQSHVHMITLIVTYQGHNPYELTPDDAQQALNAPAYVVVENADSDGTFLEAMIFAFGRRALIDAQTERWLRIDHAGGAGEIPKAVDRIRTETIGPLRVFVLCDSDRLFSGHETKTKSDIEEYCQPKNVKYAILAKRAMENYLPVSALQQVPNHRQSTYRAFLNLTQIQRDFYDMNRGFQKNHDGHAEIPPEQRDLFQHLPPTILDALCGGFGRNVWEYYKSARRDVTKAAIRLTCPDDPGEIERILDEIESLL